MVWKQSTNTSSQGTAAKFGAANINKISALFSGDADVDTVTINSPFIVQNGKLQVATITNTGTVTLPTATTTLVGRDTTDTLTNKTLTSPTISGAPIISGAAISGSTLTTSTLTSPAITTPTHTGSGGAISYPAGPDTLVGRATTDTLTNKTLTSPVVNTPTIFGASGQLLLPAGPDTFVGRDTTDTLTNKTITFPNQGLKLRNPANTFTLTQRNPVFTADSDLILDEDYDFIVFIDTADSNKVKAKGGSSRAIEFNHATDLGNVLSSIHGSLSSTSGGTVKVKSGVYGWNTQLAVTKAHVGLVAEKGASVTVNSGYATDVITVDKNDFLIRDFYYDCSAMSNGTGTWIKIAGGAVNSDRPRVYSNYVKNAPTSGIHVASSNCNGLWAVNNAIQSTASPSGNGIHLVNSADHKIYGNHVGGYADATNGNGIIFSACSNSICYDNEVFTNRVGIRTYLPSSILVYGNLVQNNQQHGIAITNDSGTTYEKSIYALNRIHDNGTALNNTYDGITFSISGAGLLNNIVVIGNTIDAHTSAKQRYGIQVNTNKLTNSTIAFNAVEGNNQGGINLGTYDSTLRCFGNAGDTVQPYLFEDFINSRIISAPADPAAGFIRYYPKTVDANNDGFFYKSKVNGAVVEVAI